MLSCASATSWGCSWACVLLLNCCPTLVCRLAVKYYRALVCSDACYPCGPSRHSTSGCQDKQTQVPCPFLGPGQSIVIHRIRCFSSLCSVQPWSVTLFYIQRSCLVSWRTWWSGALTFLIHLPPNYSGSRLLRMHIDVVIELSWQLLWLWHPRTLIAL